MKLKKSLKLIAVTFGIGATVFLTSGAVNAGNCANDTTTCSIPTGKGSCFPLIVSTCVISPTGTGGTSNRKEPTVAQKRVG